MTDAETAAAEAAQLAADEAALASPAVVTAIAAAVKTATEGLSKNKNELLDEKKALAAQLKEATEQWNGLDPAVVKNLVTRMENDEETKLMAEGKVDEVIQRRTDAMKNDYEAKLKARDEIIAANEKSLDTSKTKLARMAVDGSVRTAASELSVIPAAVEEAIHHASQIFQVGDDDKLVARDESGTIKLGKDGTTPLTPVEWLGGMKETKAHWFPGSSGAGAGGGGGPKPGAFTITRTEAQDSSKYQAAKAAAEKAGQVLQMIE